MSDQDVESTTSSGTTGAERDRFWQLSTDLFAVVDAEGRFVSVNPAWNRLTGWRDEQLLRRQITEFVHPEDRETVEAARDRLDPSGYRVLEFESRWRCADSTYRWLLWSGAVQDGVWYVVAKNVTATRSSHAALRRSERHSRALLAALRNGMYVMDANLTIIEVNDRFCELVGLERSAIEGLTPPFPWWPEDVVDILMDLLRHPPDAVQGERIARVVAADGQERRVQVDASEVPLPGDRRPGLMLIFHDLTDLLESREALALAHDAARMMSWTWDAAHDEFRLVGGGWAAEIDGDPALTLADGITKHVAAQSRDRMHTMFERALAGEEVADDILMRSDALGDAWMELRLQPLRRGDGTITGVRGTTQDISKRKSAELDALFRGEVLDAMDLAVVAIGPDLRVTEWNDAAVRLYGWTREEAVGTQVFSLRNVGLNERQPQLQDRPSDWEGDLVLRHRDGTEFPGWARVRVLHDDRGERMIVTVAGARSTHPGFGGQDTSA